MILDVDKILKYINANDNICLCYKYYVEHCVTLNNPYHNINHTLCVLNTVINIYEDVLNKPENYDFTLTNYDLYVLIVSAIFCDYNHSGGMLNVASNIENAKNGVECALSSVLENNETRYAIIEACKETLEAFDNNYSYNELNTRQRIMRESDIMTVFYESVFFQNVFGLKNEMSVSDYKVFLTDYIKHTINNWKRLNLNYSNRVLEGEQEKVLGILDGFCKIFL